jgi:Leucine-rich repeat (LRR) protein
LFEAIDIAPPREARAREALEQAVLHRGEFSEVQKALQRRLALLPANHSLRGTISALLRRCQQLDPKREIRAAHWVLSAGGSVTVLSKAGRRDVKAKADLPGEPFSVWTIHLAGQPVKDADLAVLAGLKGLTYLDLGGTGVSDAALTHLQGLDSLTWLSLSGTQVRGPGLARLAGLSRLTYLELKDAGGALEDLPALPELRELHLSGSKLNDTAMKRLKGLSRLETLSLGSTAVTDRGLALLADLKELRTLFVGGTRGVTDQGIARLKQTLPKLQVGR